MSFSSDFFNMSYEWLISNWTQIVFSIIGVIIIFFIYKFLTKQITRLKDKEKLDETVAFSLNRIFKYSAALIILAILFAIFGFEIGLFAGLFALAGGTIIGFAAMNTIGNAIAGIIIMTSRPFKIGDRVEFNGQFADVIAVDLIYTRMRTLDNVLVSIPNQELLKTEIENYEKKRTIRRKHTITVGYEVDAVEVEKTLLEAAGKVEFVMKNPKPYVRITEFGNFAAEYTLYVFMNQIKKIQEIDAEIRRTVLQACKEHGIDLSTPSLIRSVK